MTEIYCDLQLRDYIHSIGGRNDSTKRFVIYALKWHLEIHMQDDKLIIGFENVLQCFMPLCNPVVTLYIVYMMSEFS